MKKRVSPEKMISLHNVFQVEVISSHSEKYVIKRVVFENEIIGATQKLKSVARESNQ